MTSITKTVEVETEVDFEIELEHIEEFINEADDDDLRKIRSWVNAPFNPFETQFKIETLADQMKLEFLQSVWDKYTCEQMEERLK